MFVQYGNRTLTFCSRSWMMVYDSDCSQGNASGLCFTYYTGIEPKPLFQFFFSGSKWNDFSCVRIK